MIVNNHRSKLLNAMIYFAENTKNCSKTKLLKLLFLLDFDHFREYGRSVTGSKYYALPLGPVPLETYSEFDEPAADFQSAISVRLDQFHGHPRQLVEAAHPFESDLFTSRELRLLAEISEKYREHNASEMVEVTHAEGGVWDIVWNNRAGIGREIAYELSLVGLPDAKDVLEMAREREEFIGQFGGRHANGVAWDARCCRISSPQPTSGGLWMRGRC